jgi:hypothetical protein
MIFKLCFPYTETDQRKQLHLMVGTVETATHREERAVQGALKMQGLPSGMISSYLDNKSRLYNYSTRRMASSGMLRSVALVRTDVSEELSSVRRLLVTANVLPSSPILVTLMMEALSFSEGSYKTHVA